MTTLTEHLARGEPALGLTLELPFRFGGPTRLEVRVARPAEPDAPSPPSPVATADDCAPTWEDAEWQ